MLISSMVLQKNVVMAIDSRDFVEIASDFFRHPAWFNHPGFAGVNPLVI
jgi:hypothetical protein